MSTEYSNEPQGIFNTFEQKQTLPNSTATLVLGILSILLSFCYGIPGLICGIIGIVLGSKDSKLVNESPGRYTSSSINNAKAGKVCSIIGTVLSAIVIFSVILYSSYILKIFNEASSSSNY